MFKSFEIKCSATHRVVYIDKFPADGQPTLPESYATSHNYYVNVPLDIYPTEEEANTYLQFMRVQLKLPQVEVEIPTKGQPQTESVQEKPKSKRAPRRAQPKGK